MIQNLKFQSKIGIEPGRTIIDDHQRSLLEETTQRLFQLNNDLRPYHVMNLEILANFNDAIYEFSKTSEV